MQMNSASLRTAPPGQHAKCVTHLPSPVGESQSTAQQSSPRPQFVAARCQTTTRRRSSPTWHESLQRCIFGLGVFSCGFGDGA
eukprot:COSAG01_NODE_1163_length_11454_cov_3.546808_15_plen_83_part_00